MLETFVLVAGFLLSVGGSVAGWISFRRNELRRDEVLAWVNQGIECFQTIALLAHPTWFPLADKLRSERMAELSIKASVLIEQGRMFFKNQPRGKFGSEKEPAYRGVRPLILDELVVMHGLARDWPTLTAEERSYAFQIAVQCLKRFVSMAQQEVGRERSASQYVASAGQGVHFKHLLRELRQTGLVERAPIEVPQKPWWRRVWDSR